MKKKQPSLFAWKVVGVTLAIIFIPLLVGMTIANESNNAKEPMIIEYRVSVYNGGKEVEHWSTTNKIFHTGNIIDFKDQDGYDVHIYADNYAIQRQR
jgi:hypothetical protein